MCDNERKREDFVVVLWGHLGRMFGGPYEWCMYFFPPKTFIKPYLVSRQYARGIILITLIMFLKSLLFAFVASAVFPVRNHLNGGLGIGCAAIICLKLGLSNDKVSLEFIRRVLFLLFVNLVRRVETKWNKWNVLIFNKFKLVPLTFKVK